MYACMYTDRAGLCLECVDAKEERGVVLCWHANKYKAKWGVPRWMRILSKHTYTYVSCSSTMLVGGLFRWTVAGDNGQVSVYHRATCDFWTMHNMKTRSQSWLKIVLYIKHKHTHTDIHMYLHTHSYRHIHMYTTYTDGAVPKSFSHSFQSI